MSESSNYMTDADRWNHVEAGNNSGQEQICHRCRGLGTDRDDADCLACDGMGSVISRY